MSGSAAFQAVKTGMPSSFADIYHWVMEMRWPTFVGLSSLMFVTIKLLFAALYALCPGAI